jgi:hypothetical protein
VDDLLFCQQATVATLGVKDELLKQANLSYQRRGSKGEDDVIVSDSGRTAVSDALSRVDYPLLQEARQLHYQMGLFCIKNNKLSHLDTTWRC